MFMKTWWDTHFLPRVQFDFAVRKPTIDHCNYMYVTRARVKCRYFVAKTRSIHPFQRSSQHYHERENKTMRHKAR